MQKERQSNGSRKLLRETERSRMTPCERGKNTDTTCIMLSVILLTTWDSLTFTQTSAAESLICRESRLVRVTEFFTFTVNYLIYLFSLFERWQNIEQECWTKLKCEIKRCSDNREKKTKSRTERKEKNSTGNCIRSHPNQKDSEQEGK